ncbi:transport protein particle component [Trametes versicolor FP-101664 SS1]|uniref:transport protein particle component n=1 Tax=Trametes versicolor (strain FP-101664) TaxID=717944 RepID=UPI00046218F9|nr:transport protein particle component [Trametes versicolor FP-101664 SS1]EIW65119.1 transport protein particle component [Trametes versicolor FP-101664 SS1]
MSQVPSLAAVADPSPRYVDGPAVDYFVIEMVNTLRASSAVATARAKKVEQEMIDAGLMPTPAPALPALKKDKIRESMGSNASRSSISKDGQEGEEEELRARLEAIGMHVGANMAERLCHDRGLFTDTLDAIKFICKDLWSACWEKQVDNLRTNHRGVYVLQDNAFKPLTRVSGWEGRAETLRKSKIYVAMPAGIIRGALVRLGFQAVVVPEVTNLPQCTFQVKLPKGS